MYLHYSIHVDTHVDTLREIANSFTLELSMSADQVSICYTNNSQDSNSVLNLEFLHVNVEEFNSHSILPDLQGPSDLASLSVHIIIEEKFI